MERSIDDELKQLEQSQILEMIDEQIDFVLSPIVISTYEYKTEKK